MLRTVRPLRLAVALGCAGAIVACSSSGSSSPPPRAPRFADARWETLPRGGPPSPGLSDFTPTGETRFFALDGSAAFRFDPALGWTPVAGPPSPLGFAAGSAWVGGALYLVRDGAVYRHDVAAGTWTVPVASGIAVDTPYSQAAHDDAGNVYALETPSPHRLVRYTPSTGSVMILDTGGLGGNPTGATLPPRLTWDSATRRLYVGPQYQQLWAFDPSAPGTAVRRADVPNPGGGFGFAGQLCSDRAGHVYAVGTEGPCVGASAVYEYDPAADRWDPLPAPTTAMLCEASCTVADGWLYLAGGATSGSLYRIRLP